MSKISDRSAPLILAIDTATRAGSVVLMRADEVLALERGDSEASHSIDLIANVETCLNTIGAKLIEVNLFAAASGPGSFTGLRIGLATIKSFAVSVGRRCAGVPTLAAIAHAAGPSARTVALLPAGRGEVFAQLFAAGTGTVRPLDSPSHVRPEALMDKYGGIERLAWAGEGAHLYRETLLAGAEARNIRFTDGIQVDSESLNPDQRNNGEWILTPRRAELAVSIAALALDDYNHGRVVSAEALQAIYVRPSDAEIKEQWQTEKSQRPVPS